MDNQEQPKKTRKSAEQIEKNLLDKIEALTARIDKLEETPPTKLASTNNHPSAQELSIKMELMADQMGLKNRIPKLYSEYLKNQTKTNG